MSLQWWLMLAEAIYYIIMIIRNRNNMRPIHRIIEARRQRVQDGTAIMPLRRIAGDINGNRKR